MTGGPAWLRIQDMGRRKGGQLKTEPVSGQNEWLPVPESSSLTPCSLSDSPPCECVGAFLVLGMS